MSHDQHEKLRPKGRKERAEQAKLTESKKRGSFVLVLCTGKKIRFKDAEHRAAAWEALISRKFATKLELAMFAKSLPNGFTSFISTETELNTQ